MKKSNYILLLLLLVVFAGCKKDDDTDPVDKLFSFDIKNEKSFVASKADINGAYDLQQATGLSMPLPVSGVASDTEADFRNNNTSTSLVTAVTLQEMILTLPDNATENFSFLEKMDVYIAMEDGSDPLLMAYNRNVPNTNDKKLVFTPLMENNVDKYVKAGKYSLILKDTKLRHKVNTDLNITARITYKVTANPLK